MAHRGAGGPPPKRGGGRGNNEQALYYLSESITGSNGPQLKQVKALKLRPGTKNQPILTLDDIASTDDAYSVNIHMFNLRGTKDNIVVCPKTAADPRPCPVCEVLNKDPSWYVVLTGIDRNKYTFERTKDGKKSSVTYTDLRRLILITNTWTQRMNANGDRAQGFRGSLFEVTRSEPLKEMKDGREVVSYKDSPRIGDVWYFTQKLDDEQMKAEFEKRAAEYGMPVERFIQPINYDIVLKPKSHAQLTKVAEDIRSDGSAIKGGDDDDSGDASAAVASAAGAASEAEINY